MQSTGQCLIVLQVTNSYKLLGKQEKPASLHSFGSSYL